MIPEWREPSVHPSLAADEVHVWFCELSAVSHLDTSAFSLSESEKERAARYQSENARFTFVASRAFLRNVLSRYLDVSPISICFQTETNGKPRIATPADSRLQFNLSHSGHSAVCAVSRDARVGIDLEEVEPSRCDGDTAAQVFSPSELRLLAAMDKDARVESFFRGWTRKEAYAKCVGLGLSLDVRSLELRFAEGQSHSDAVTLCTFECPNGIPATVAVEAPALRPLFYRFTASCLK